MAGIFSGRLAWARQRGSASICSPARSNGCQGPDQKRWRRRSHQAHPPRLWRGFEVKKTTYDLLQQAHDVAVLLQVDRGGVAQVGHTNQHLVSAARPRRLEHEASVAARNESTAPHHRNLWGQLSWDPGKVLHVVLHCFTTFFLFYNFSKGFDYSSAKSLPHNVDSGESADRRNVQRQISVLRRQRLSRPRWFGRLHRPRSDSELVGGSGRNRDTRGRPRPQVLLHVSRGVWERSEPRTPSARRLNIQQHFP